VSPSKENCLKAQEAFEFLRRKLSIGIAYEEAQFIGDFLASAAKRLPKEASLIKDKNRKRTKK
jgi:hypothetical protein